MTVQPTNKGGIQMQSHNVDHSQGNGSMNIDGISAKAKTDDKRITDQKVKKEPLPGGGSISSSSTE